MTINPENTLLKEQKVSRNKIGKIISFSEERS